MAKDPTANAAARNVTGQERAAVIQYREDGHPARLWLDLSTFRGLRRLVVVLTDDSGERHIRFNNEAAQLLAQLSGSAPSKGRD